MDMKTVKGILVISLTMIWVWMAPGCQDSGRGAVKTPDSLASRQGDPLPSWVDGRLKRSIIDYVKQVTDSKRQGFYSGRGSYRHFRQ